MLQYNFVRFVLRHIGMGTKSGDFAQHLAIPFAFEKTLRSGVDEADTTKESNFTTLLEQIGAIKGLRALWVLQHQRGYKPFLMKTPLKMTLNNPRNGTIIHYISLDNCN